MIIQLNEEEVEVMIKEYLKKHFASRFPDQWMSGGITGKVIIAVNKDQAQAQVECYDALNNRRKTWG